MNVLETMIFKLKERYIYRSKETNQAVKKVIMTEMYIAYMEAIAGKTEEVAAR